MKKNTTLSLLESYKSGLHPIYKVLIVLTNGNVVGITPFFNSLYDARKCLSTLSKVGAYSPNLFGKLNSPIKEFFIDSFYIYREDIPFVVAKSGEIPF